MTVVIGADTATLISAAATAVYAVIAAISLALLSRQIRDARRFGAAPALYALLKEMDEHMAAFRSAAAAGDDAATRETVIRYLDFFERVEHLRGAGLLPAGVLRRALGPALHAHLADPHFAAVIAQDARQHAEVLRLAERLGRPAA